MLFSSSHSFFAAASTRSGFRAIPTPQREPGAPVVHGRADDCRWGDNFKGKVFPGLSILNVVFCALLIPICDCQRMAIVTAQEVGVTLAAEKIDATYMPEQPGSETTPSPAPL